MAVSVELGTLLDAVRKKNGIVHQITNYVTVNDCANMTLAVGASPLMADEPEEVAEIVALSSALVLNMGTLHSRSIQAMLVAGKAANQHSVPVVIDPVGLGASRLRTETMQRFLHEFTPQILRGNMSEIAFLAGTGGQSRGVDVTREDAKRMESEGALLAATCAKRYGCVVAITGATDIISNGTRTVYCKNGHPMLGRVTGTGCMCTALIGAFHTATGISPKNSLLAAVGGVAAMGIAGERAFSDAGEKGTASFRTALIDCISALDATTLQNKTKISEAAY